MNNVLLQRAIKLNRNSQNRKRWQNVVRSMAAVVVFCTTYALILPAITMEGTLVCDVEEHTHTEVCYEQQPVMGLACLPEGNAVVHTHDSRCYNDQQVLTCSLPERNAHTHDESCYSASLEPQCAYVHIHSEVCTGTNITLTCTLQEIQAHTHGEACMAAEVPCPVPEAEGHTHTEACYFIEQRVCDLTVNDDHVHTEECYPRQLSCGREALQLHSHADACYGPEGSLTCGLLVVISHQHSDGCFVPTAEYESVLSCTMTEHTHTEECYEEGETDSGYLCGMGAHAHEQLCYDAEGNLICTIPQHMHEAACLVADLDMTADVETAAQWESAIANLNLTGSCSDKLLAVARSQLYYQESVRNVILENQELKGYTRYGAKYGMPYAEWAGLFACFCVDYVGADEEFPVNTDLAAWMKALEKKEWFLSEKGLQPQPGELVFFGTDLRSAPEGALSVTAVGILETWIPATDGEDAKLKVILGDVNGMVDYVTVYQTDALILGYAVVPDPVAEPEETEPEPVCGYDEHTHDETCYDAETKELICTETVHSHTESCYKAEETEEPAELTCALGEHTHGEGCYDAATGDLTCTETEHSHTEECYKAEETEESAELICTLTEHTHGEGCYDAETGVLICTETEHSHSEECYKAEETEEPAELICTLTEHTHGEGCYDAETGVLICTETEHTHTEECRKTENAYADLYRICGMTAHTHEDSCTNPETGDIICGMSAHTHGDACYAAEDNLPMMDLPLACALTEHTHEAACYDAETGELVCTETEHAHTSECYGPAETVFTYEDDRVIMEVTVVCADGLPKGLTMEVGALSMEDQEAYAAYAQENAQGELLELTGYQIRFFLEGKEIELPGAQITADMTIRPVTQEETETEVQTYAATPAQSFFGNDIQLAYASVSVDAAYAAISAEETQTEAQQPVVVSVLQQGEADITRSGTATFDGTSSEGTQITVIMDSARTVALASETAPTFTVEFYANMPHYVTDEDGSKSDYPASLDIIDTRGYGDGKGGSLPSVGSTSTPNTKNGVLHLYLESYASQDKEGNAVTTYKPATEYKLTEVYTADSKTYIPGMDVEYLNKLKDNHRYAIEQVWVSQDGGETFRTYGLSLDDGAEVDVEINDINTITFTNNPDSASDAEGVLLITSDTVIRFEYHVIQDYYSNSANFYDYDISTGVVWNKAQNGTSYASANAAKNAGYSTYYIQTNKKGINSTSNYVNSGKKLAFGNDNTGMGLSTEKVGSMYINQYNRESNSIAAFKGCAFGIVSGYDYNSQSLIYSSGIAHQNLFNESSSVTGKTIYGGQVLNFERVGDTYTLVAVNGGRSSGSVGEYRLNEFFNPGGYTTIFTNNFWPMDNVVSDSTKGRDIKFGDTSSYNNGRRNYTNRNGSNGKLPPSDDGLRHNSFFGMQYAISFTMDGMYCGPLEYLFYGDDDMWVFLTDHQTGKTHLICDIGGVHSSVGSYTDLWDYIQKGEAGKGDYTLSFFYLERGASGSSCYMAFTLPAVTSVSQDVPDFGTLKIHKEAPGEGDPAATYQFRLDLSGTGEGDRYSYMVSGGETRTGSIASGETFSMAEGETVTILNLPDGIEYTLTELFATDTEKTYDVQWTNSDGSTVSGNILSSKVIQGGTTETIQCTNTALGSLEVEKQVVGTESADEYTIEITLADEAGEPVSGTFGETVFTEGKATVELGHKEKVTLTGIPAGTVWTVSEEAPRGFSASYLVNGEAARTASGTIVHSTTVAVTVVNTTSYKLPETGGMGTHLYNMGGSILIAAGLWLLYDKHRRFGKEAQKRC